MYNLAQMSDDDLLAALKNEEMQDILNGNLQQALKIL